MSWEELAHDVDEIAELALAAHDSKMKDEIKTLKRHTFGPLYFSYHLFHYYS